MEGLCGVFTVKQMWLVIHIVSFYRTAANGGDLTTITPETESSHMLQPRQTLLLLADIDLYGVR